MAGRLRRVTVATVHLWDHEVGAVAWDAERGLGRFEYAPDFLRLGLAVAPLTMPLRPGIFSFAGLNRGTFRGLPGLLNDSLPDRFGNAVIDLWLQQQGRDVADFSPVERLCTIGSRGMGALEFLPALAPRSGASVPLEVAELSRLAAEILRNRAGLAADLRADSARALDTIFRVGTSAGGARAKALIAWHPQTGEVRSGQVAPPAGFELWLLKFDGVRDDALGDPQGYGRVEFAYHKMAAAAGITMSPCRLLEEGGRAHFMTRRFDRDDAGGKLHLQSLCALAHFDFNASGAYGYEQVFAVVQKLNLGHAALREQYRRMVFNILARNQDDHTRNIAFLMDRQGRWQLAPAFDVIWAYNPTGRWTDRHQLSLAGKRDGFTREDLLGAASLLGIRDAMAILGQVRDTVAQWPQYAEAAGVPAPLLARVAESLRGDI
jgi:serine/threonine-protein kinase HipA